MKKGVVLSVHKRSITLLTPDGEFVKSRRLHQDYEIGEEISYKPAERPLKLLLYFSGHKAPVIGAVATCILLFSIVIPRFSNHVSAYMTIDVNPSIELGLDDELHVVELNGLNKDGKQVVAQLNEWKNQEVSTVAKNIILKTAELGYMESTAQKIMVSTTMIDEDTNLNQQLNKEVKGISKQIPIGNTEVKLIQATESDRNQAKKQGISTGKFVEQQLKREKRKDEKLKLNKKNDDQGNTGHLNTHNKSNRDKQVNVKAPVKDGHDALKNTKSSEQNRIDNQRTSEKFIKNKQENKQNTQENKGHLGNKDHSEKKSNSSNQGNSKKKTNSSNQGHSEKKSDSSNQGHSEKKSDSSNQWNSEKKSDSSNQGNLEKKSDSSNQGNLEKKSDSSNQDHSEKKSDSENKGNSENSGHSDKQEKKGES